MTTTEDLPIPPAPGGRRVPVWASTAAAIATALLVCGAGYAAGRQAVAGERDAAVAARADAEDARDDVEDALAATESQLAECVDLAASVSSLQDGARELAAEWQEFVRLMDAWSMTAAGSPEEMAAADDLLQQENQLTPRSGEVTAAAAGVEADITACEGNPSPLGDGEQS